MRILIGMNLSPLWRETLKKKASKPCIVFTHDLDFGHLLALTHAAGPSVIQVRSENVLPESIGPVVLRALRQLHDLLSAGALVVIEPSDFRVRILPIY